MCSSKAGACTRVYLLVQLVQRSFVGRVVGVGGGGEELCISDELGGWGMGRGWCESVGRPVWRGKGWWGEDKFNLDVNDCKKTICILSMMLFFWAEVD